MTTDTTETRLWPKIDRGGEAGCWKWTAGLTSSGYGSFAIGPELLSRLAHRVVYELLVGPIPDGYQLDHLCRNRSCVNPDHLEVVTAAENIRRGEGLAAINARKTHCLRGHEFTPANTAVMFSSGYHWRRCRACHYLHSVKESARRKLARAERRSS